MSCTERIFGEQKIGERNRGRQKWDREIWEKSGAYMKMIAGVGSAFNF